MSEASTNPSPEAAPVEKRRPGRPKAPPKTRRQALAALRKSVRVQGPIRTIDSRTAIGRQLLEWRRSLTDDLGGEEALSTQRKALIDIALGDYWLLLTVDSALLEMTNVVNRRTRKLTDLALQRSRIADGLARRLDALGLDRKRAERPVQSVRQYLAGETSS